MPIPRYQDENLGSLILIEYAPAWKVASFTPTGKGTINAAGITLAVGYSWETMYCSEDTMGHQQSQGNDDNGESWQQQVVGFVPGDEDEIEAALLLLTNQRYILRCTRPNGKIKIVGTPDAPLDFKLVSDSQSTVPGTAGTGITFSGLTPARALIYAV